MEVKRGRARGLARSGERDIPQLMREVTTENIVVFEEPPLVPPSTANDPQKPLVGSATAVMTKSRPLSYEHIPLAVHTIKLAYTVWYWAMHPYWHWWGVVSSYNVVLIVLFFVEGWSPFHAALMAIINVLVAALIRNAYVVRFIFEVVTLLARTLLLLPYLHPTSTLVFLLNRSVHNLGGIHTGSALYTVVWVTIYLIMAPIRYHDGSWEVELLRMIALEITAALLLLLVLVMSLFALPFVRNDYHNLFELTHRFCGWAASGILLAHTAIAQGTWFPFTTGFALALAIAALVFYPWFLIRRQRKAKVLSVSSRAIALSFAGGLIPSTPGTFVRFSFSPLIEWHAFAVASVAPPEVRTLPHEMTAVIARAGDWTTHLIESNLDRLPENGDDEGYVQLHRPLWVHFHTPPGFMFSARCYDEVLFVATGAGIAPILSYLSQLQNPLVPKCDLLWIAHKPLETFSYFAEAVTAHENVVLHDTSVQGRPVVDELCVLVFNSLPLCQAVFVVANQPVTRAIQKMMFSIGVPCFGAEWDS